MSESEEVSPSIELVYAALPRRMNVVGNIKTAENMYLVFNASDELAALEAVRTGAPRKVGRSWLMFVDIESRVDKTTWRVKAIYEALKGAHKVNNAEVTVNLGSEIKDLDGFSYSNGGGSRMMKIAYSQTRLKGTLKAGNLVGWNGRLGDDMNVDGVSVPCASQRFSIRRGMKVDDVRDVNWLENCSKCVGKVNDSYFMGYAAGRVMYLGQDYDGKFKDELIVVTFNFEVRNPEELKLDINGATTSFTIPGYDYVWNIAESVVDSNGDPKVEMTDVFQAQVVESADFSVLGAD